MSFMPHSLEMTEIVGSEWNTFREIDGGDLTVEKVDFSSWTDSKKLQQMLRYCSVSYLTINERMTILVFNYLNKKDEEEEILSLWPFTAFMSNFTARLL